jgi:thiol-disulfide isomerase/thioredoxin
MKLARFAIGVCLLLIFAPRAVFSADPPKAEDAIRKMSDFYKQQKSFSVKADTNVEIHGAGINNSSKSSYTAIVARPNKIAIKDDGRAGLTLVSDGDTLSIAVAAAKKYMQTDAPDSLAELAGNPLVTVGARGTLNFAIALTTSDPAKLILDGVTASKDLGVAPLNGQPARHLSFTRGKLEWEAWVADGAQPRLLQVSYDLSKMIRLGTKDVKLNVTQTFKDWKFGIAVSPKDFTFTAPKNAKEVHNLLGRSEEDEEPSPLLGKAAPKVDLERLDGKRVKLADNAGKDVVMLDMWATWCGPCRAELPHLVNVAKDYKGKGVVFYAIDLREKKDKIDEFLKKEKLDMTVGLDSNGKLAEACGVEGIPMLMLIDKNGVVQVVHVGYDPAGNVETKLHKELDSLLAGKDLASVTLAQFEVKKKAAEAAREKRKKEREKTKKAATEQTAR